MVPPRRLGATGSCSSTASLAPTLARDHDTALFLLLVQLLAPVVLVSVVTLLVPVLWLFCPSLLIIS
ncbi:hypothetical protein GUJ93_ZPchr0003g18614 [Zizania palustris]|uniref:Uncharacterized protein n=1 Tax=Zizania palustris TaxID=103762 RepID=A0A8J5V5P6_ZIZPA|nr:hypothetical protein GUJ93_ZPchr0003g18614 [Zizania palustris]